MGVAAIRADRQTLLVRLRRCRPTARVDARHTMRDYSAEGRHRSTVRRTGCGGARSKSDISALWRDSGGKGTQIVRDHSKSEKNAWLVRMIGALEKETP